MNLFILRVDKRISPRMEKLPELVLVLIGEYLSYEDLLSLRRTCKTLKQFVDQKQFESLFLFVQRYPKYHQLFHGQGSISYPNSLRLSDLSQFQSIRSSGRFSLLRKLFVFNFRSYTPEGFVLGWINSFERLEYFEASNFDKITGKLTSKSLRVASFGTSNESPFELDCPQLRALRIVNFAEPTLTGDNLEYLSIVDTFYITDENPFNPPHFLRSFSSLDHLTAASFKEIKTLNIFLDLIIGQEVSVPSLRRVELDCCVDFADFGLLLDKLNDLNKRRDRVDLFLNGQMVKTDKEDPKTDRILKFIHSAETCRTASHINYRFIFLFKPVFSMLEYFHRWSRDGDPFIDYWSSGFTVISIDHCLKSDSAYFFLIPRLKNVYFLKIVNKLGVSDALYEAVTKAFRKVEYLRIQNAYMRQDQLDRLPDRFLNLYSFEYLTDPEDMPYSLQFVTRFKNLKVLRFRVNLRRELLTFLFANCPSLFRVDFDTILNNQFIKVCIFKEPSRIIICKPGRLGGLLWNYDNCCNEDRFCPGPVSEQKELEFDTLESCLDFYYSHRLFDVDYLEKQQEDAAETIDPDLQNNL